jgi:hypothetical protein
VEKVTSRGIALTWDLETRVAVLRFEHETRATGQDARVLVDAFRGWIGTGGEPFALLGDGDKLASIDAEYRSLWANFLIENRDRVHIAFFNMNPLIRIAADMFRLGTGLNIRAFGENEEEARSWLRQQGIPA